MNTIDRVPRPDLGVVIRALIDEAWRRARRRRLMYAGILFSMAVIGAVVLAALQSPANSQTSPAVLAGPNTSAFRITATEHFVTGVFRCRGKRGTLTLLLRFGSSSRSWQVASERALGRARTGQYARIVVRPADGGDHVAAGGRGTAWTARLVGFVTSRAGGRKQRVVIRLRGRPNGTFTLVPVEPGVLERDSGTQSSDFRG